MKPLLLAALAIAPLSSGTTQGVRANETEAGLGGVLVPGVCLLSRAAVLGQSKAGVAATQRLQELAKQAQAEIDADRKPIAADRQALQTEAVKLSPAELQARAKQLDERLAPVERKAELRNREIEATREKAIARIVAAMRPLVAQSYKAHGCGLLLDRAAVLGGNLGNDLTPEIIKSLDVDLPPFAFDRENLASAPKGQ